MSSHSALPAMGLSPGLPQQRPVASRQPPSRLRIPGTLTIARQRPWLQPGVLLPGSRAQNIVRRFRDEDRQPGADQEVRFALRPSSQQFHISSMRLVHNIMARSCAARGSADPVSPSADDATPLGRSLHAWMASAHAKQPLTSSLRVHSTALFR